VARGTLQAAFGQVLKDLRHHAGLSQEQLALECGLHRTYVSQLERGLKSPSLAASEVMAAALGSKPHLMVKAAEDTRDSLS